MREIYQRIYATRWKNYGEASANHCPGVRLFDHYQKFLRSPIVDLGCGTGDTVRLLRDRGFEASGIDWVDLKNGMRVGDITEDLCLAGIRTVLAMDVLEHIPEDRLAYVFGNMAQAENQIMSISNTPSWVEYEGEEMINTHVTDRPFSWWGLTLSSVFDIIHETRIRPCQMLYITRRKRRSEQNE